MSSSLVKHNTALMRTIIKTDIFIFSYKNAVQINKEKVVGQQARVVHPPKNKIYDIFHLQYRLEGIRMHKVNGKFEWQSEFNVF